MLSFIKQPYLQWPTHDSMTVMWETSSDASSLVTVYETHRVHATGTGRFLPVDSSVRAIEGPGAASCVHCVTISGLEPETSYLYQVSSKSKNGESCESDVYPMKTAVVEETPFCFAVTSETGGTCNDTYNREVFHQIRLHRPDFLMVVGDSVCKGSQYSEWNRYFFTPAQDLLTTTPFYLVPGNHEENSDWFYKFVHYPEPKNYYSYRYGNALFVGLDSIQIVEYVDGKPRLVEGAFEPGAPQFDMLTERLKETDAVWKIVFFHYPPYVSADYQVDEMRILCPILEQYGVQVVFNSHTIAYERSHPIRRDSLDLESGITYVVAGGAGAMQQWFHHKRAWHTAHAIARPHFVQVVIAGTRLELQAIDFEGNLFDKIVLEQ